MPRETRLYRALVARGLDVEYVPGWSTRGSTDFAPFGALAHWTAGPRTGDRPSLNICVNGRPGLPGPLCNVFLPRGLTPATRKVILVAAGRANHAGRGDFQGADGNSDVFGTEAEWSGRPGELTDFQLWAYPRINAAFMDLGARWVAGHDEFAVPRGRKVDVGHYINTLRAETYTLVRGGTPTTKTLSEEDDDMPTAQEIALAVWGYKNPKVNGSRDAYNLLTQVDTKVGAYLNAQNSETLAVVREIKKAVLNTDVGAAVKKALAELNIDVDEQAVADAVVARLVEGIAIEGTITTTAKGA